MLAKRVNILSRGLLMAKRKREPSKEERGEGDKQVGESKGAADPVADSVYLFYKRDEGERDEMVARIEAMAREEGAAERKESGEGGGRRKRRYSDQFKYPGRDRLYIEREKNRKAKIVDNFRKGNDDIEGATSRWKDALLGCASELLKEEPDRDRGELYSALGLEALGIAREELGIEESP